MPRAMEAHYHRGQGLENGSREAKKLGTEIPGPARGNSMQVKVIQL
jgi:hypothetical protein